MMRKIHFFLGYCSVCLTMPLAPVIAEVTCSADVSYAWTHAINTSNAEEDISDSAASAGDAVTPAATVGVAASPAATKTGVQSPEPAVSPTAAGKMPPPTGSPTGKSTTDSSKPKVVLFARVERSGGSEDDARAALGFEAERQKNRAAERCKRAHESVGECVTTKLSGKASTLNSLSFSARTQAEKALIDECKVQEGRCLAVESSTPVCRVKGGSAAAETPPPASAGQPSVAAEKAPSEGAKAEEKAEPKKAESGKPAAKKK